MPDARLNTITADMQKAAGLVGEAMELLAGALHQIETLRLDLRVGVRPAEVLCNAYPTEHRRKHRPGRAPRIDTDPELAAFISARIDRMTFVDIAARVAEVFPEPRRVGRSPIYAWRQSRDHAMADRFDIDQLEADLGRPAALRIIEALGGQRRSVPSLAYATRSRLAKEIGPVNARWIAVGWAGEMVEFPSRLARHRERDAALLLADVIAAGLDNPTQSANDIAKANGVSSRRVQQIRQQLRTERDAEAQKQIKPLPR
jgi:hypothetical protein